jgi:hypothetical protein
LNGSSSLCEKQGHLKGDLSKLRRSRGSLGDGSYAPEIRIQEGNGFEIGGIAEGELVHRDTGLDAHSGEGPGTEHKAAEAMDPPEA